MGTGASRMIDPLLLGSSVGCPDVAASPVRSNRCKALPVVMPDRETATRDRVGALTPPCQVATGLVVQIPADTGDTVGQGQGQAGIVCPLAGSNLMRSVTAIAGDRGKSAGPLELNGRTQCVPDGQSEKRSALAVGVRHHLHSQASRYGCPPQTEAADRQIPTRWLRARGLRG